jgi:predicted Zn-dependent protease
MVQKFFLILIAFAFFGGAIATPARAQTIIRDTEIEAYMAEWFAPIFAAAGMSPDQVNIIIVQDSQVNAFVAGGSNIFFYTGLLQKTENPGEVIGVMAHELGHITGGHLIRGREAMEQASYESILGTILGVGAAIATGDGAAAATIGAASSSMASRGFLKYSRTFEASADQAALGFFERAQLNPTGLESFLEKLAGQELLPSSQQSEYVRSHPLTRSRVETVAARTSQSPHRDKPWPQEWVRQHRMMIAKLTGFITPQQVAWKYDDRDNSRESVTARAIAAYRTNDVAKALKLADQLIAMEPQNPYFLELKGQMLMDFGRVKEAVPFYERALAKKPDAGLIRIPLAHAQIESAGNNPAVLKQAIENLKRARESEPRSPRLHRLLATAYGRSGDEPRAKLHLAEEAVLQGRFENALSQAKSAEKGLKQGSADWIRANDIILHVESREPPRK